jgi:hypothetical protein
VVLAYSGGLDTSVILKWLQDTYGCEVVTFTADLGQVGVGEQQAAVGGEEEGKAGQAAQQQAAAPAAPATGQQWRLPPGLQGAAVWAGRWLQQPLNVKEEGGQLLGITYSLQWAGR